jgi:hypothetical protein
VLNDTTPDNGLSASHTMIVMTVMSASTSPGLTSSDPQRPDVDAVRRELVRKIAGDAVVLELKCETGKNGIRVGSENVGDGKYAAQFQRQHISSVTRLHETAGACQARQRAAPARPHLSAAQ